jgi:HK97 family phage major capsid protein
MASVNGMCRAHAEALIRAGKVNRSAAWSFTAADGDALLGAGGDDWSNYARFHLAVDSASPEKTKGHYGYPIGKGGEVYRSGVVAAKQRAAQQGEGDIEAAAGALLELIDKGAQQRRALSRRMPVDLPALARSEKVKFDVPKTALERWDPTLPNLKATPPEVTELAIIAQIGPEDFGGVDSGMVRQALKQAGDAPIRLVLNSPGGDAHEGIAIYNLLAAHPAPVTVSIIGEACSAASLIAMAGDHIEMGEATQMMIHSAWALAIGNADDLLKVRDYLNQLDEGVAAIYAKRCGQSQAAVLAMMKKETWMSAQDAVEQGFADVALADEQMPMMPDKKKKPAARAQSIFSAGTVPAALAASGHGRRFELRLSAAAPSPGVTGTTRKPVSSLITSKGTPVKIREQIQNFENKRAANMARMEAIMGVTLSESRGMDEKETKEYEDLKTEIGEIDVNLVRMKDHEKLLVARAEPVPTEEHAPVRAGAIRIEAKSEIEKKIPGVAFTRFVKALGIAKGSPHGALMHAQANKQWKDETPVVEQALMAAVAAGDTTTSTWASEWAYAQNLVGDFINFLRPQTIVGKIPGLTNVPFNVRVAGQTSGSTAYWVGQGASTPVSKLGTNAVTLGIAKAAGIVVLDAELIRISTPSADMLTRNDLTKAIAQFQDVQFVDPGVAAVANVSPASITSGVEPVAAAGATTANFRADIAKLISTLVTLNLDPRGFVLIMTPIQALQISLMVTANGVPYFPNINMNGGELLGIPVVTSMSAQIVASPSTGEGGLLILFAAPEVMLADDGAVAVEASSEAALQMLDNPTGASTGGTAAVSMVSMFQTNSVAIKATRFMNWAKRRSGIVAYVKDAAYTPT